MALLLTMILVFTLAACGGGGSGTSSSGGSGGSGQSQGSSGGSGGGGGGGDSASDGEKVKLTIWLWPGMGFEDQMQRYADQNNIEIEIQHAEYSDHHTNLQTAMASGSGAPDIAGVEISQIERFKENPHHFHNLLDFGAANVQGDYLDWKWEQTLSADKSMVLGLPTDIGPMALLYRTDVFADAGLPTDREEVAALMPTWEDFIEVGIQVKNNTGSWMIHNATTMFALIVGQGDEKHFDRDNNLIVETNPQVKKAWDLTMRAIEAGITGNIHDSTERVTALNNGDYAVVLAPAWEMTAVKKDAPDTAGLWDVTQIPEGSGNRGGSFLTVPAQSKHPQEAYNLIEWVLAPEQQLELFTTLGNFPSTPGIYDSEELVGYVDEFFSGAPVGEIYSEAAKRVKPVWEGPYTHIASAALDDAIKRVEAGQQDPESSWNQAIEDIKRQLSRQ